MDSSELYANMNPWKSFFINVPSVRSHCWNIENRVSRCTKRYRAKFVGFIKFVDQNESTTKRNRDDSDVNVISSSDALASLPMLMRNEEFCLVDQAR